jgi:hypothetical protein
MRARLSRGCSGIRGQRSLVPRVRLVPSTRRTFLLTTPYASIESRLTSSESGGRLQHITLATLWCSSRPGSGHLPVSISALAYSCRCSNSLKASTELSTGNKKDSFVCYHGLRASGTAVVRGHMSEEGRGMPSTSHGSSLMRRTQDLSSHPCDRRHWSISNHVLQRAVFGQSVTCHLFARSGGEHL